jgi:predicted Zn finger-like uncharacterized protein
LKFLCENCRAKYQIADEKVAGRTVRMKCRKCGHLIEVEASVTESSTVAKAPHAPARPAGIAAAAAALRPVGVATVRGFEGRSAAVSGEETAGEVSSVSAEEASVRPPATAKGGLASAFSKAVAVPENRASAVSAAFSVLSSRPDIEEWYVGINGVPVGPVRLGELRRKAAGGAITPESLVWREGFEEWVPLKTFPELLTMYREAVSLGRATLTPTPPPPARVASGPPRPPSVTPPPRAQPLPRPAALPVARAFPPGSDEPIELRFDEGEPSVVVTETPESQSFAAPLSVEGLRVMRARRPITKRIPPGAVIAVLVSLLLGMAIMVLLEGRQSSGVQIVSVPVPIQQVPAPAAPAVAADEGQGVTTIGAIEIGAAAQKGSSGAARTGTGKAADTPAGAAAPANTSLTGLGGLVGGPSSPGGGATPSGGGGQLAASDVERVVQSHRAFVKRQCWESALAARPANAPSSVRVAVSITVGSDGRVQSTSASGGDAYPGLSSCVQSQVRNWTFPRSDGATVTVPFVFAAQ